MILAGAAALHVLAHFSRVRCRQCGGGDCPGCIDGPLFCVQPDPAFALGAEDTEEALDEDPPARPTDACGEQLSLLDRPEWP